MNERETANKGKILHNNLHIKTQRDPTFKLKRLKIVFKTLLFKYTN